MVEFALVIPIFLMGLVAIGEFSALLTIRDELTYATQDAAQAAARLGNTAGADCSVLEGVDGDLQAPLKLTSVKSVRIFWTDPYGHDFGGDSYTYGGSWTCPDKTVVSWGPPGGGGGYPDSTRCAALLGCGGSHPGVDWIGVTITYQYTWLTPVPGLVGLAGSAPTIAQTTTTRLEPTQ